MSLFRLSFALLILAAFSSTSCQQNIYESAISGDKCPVEYEDGRVYTNRKLGISIKVPRSYMPIPAGYRFQLLESRNTEEADRESLCLARDVSELEIEELEGAFRREYRTGEDVLKIAEGTGTFNNYPGTWKVYQFPMSPYNTRLLRVDFVQEGTNFSIMLASNVEDFDELLCQYIGMMNTIRLTS